jgi:hypothetical protein
MRASAALMPFAVALAACRTPPRYLVTTAPIDVGVVSTALCVGIDPGDERGVWWWEPGRSGCGTRSTGPDTFHAERAEVKGGSVIEVSFRLQLKRAPGSPLPDFADVHLVVEDGAIRAAESGVRVALAARRSRAPARAATAVASLQTGSTLFRTIPSNVIV